MQQYYTYVISSKTKQYIYVGITKDPQRRINEHNRGKERTTAPYTPFQIVLVESYSCRKDAREREKYLKSGCGKEWIKDHCRPYTK